jgi:glycosyltransferase involved in cell wall biosynthesis
VSTFRQALTELGHNVFIFAQQDSNYEDKEPFIFRYPSVDLPLTSGFPITIPISPFIDKLLPYLKLDIIHSHHPFLLGQTAMRKAAELDLPLIFTFHTRYRDYSHYISLSQELVKEAISRWLGEYMQKCNHIIVPSESIKHMLLDEYGIIERITVVPTGIDLRPYQQIDVQAVRQERNWEDKLILVSVGRLAKEKNWETLLAGVAAAIKGREQVRLVIIGDGDYRRDLESVAGDLGIGEQVEFTGNVPFEDIPGYLCAADLFCFASTTETQGLVTMEALAAKLPVVAVDASGTRDVIENEKDGFLTLNEPEAFGRAVARMINDPDLRERFRNAAWQKAQTFEMKLQAQKLVAVYEQAIEDYRADQRVRVDEQKEAFNSISEEQWTRLVSVGSGSVHH